jgi:glycosyltransferase involved in cell wall biosynthesis
LKRVLAVIGDLNSRSGYSKAIELYVSALAESFDVIIGCDIHHHPATNYPRFKFPMVAPVDLKNLSSDKSVRLVVLNVTTPDHFIRIPGALNVGCFFWETDHIPETWINDLKLMDEIWSPMRFLVPVLEFLLPGKTVLEFPCPIAVTDNSGAKESEIFFTALDPAKSLKPGKEAWCTSDIKRHYGKIHLVISSNVKRKGLPILFNDWMSEFGGKPNAALLLKISSANVTLSAADLFKDIKQDILSYCERYGVSASNVFLTAGKFTESQMTSLIKDSDVYLSTSLGEGMGLGVFESLWHGKPVICPRHTTFADYLPESYPLFMECDYKNAAFHDEFGIYPISSSWGVLRDNELSRAFSVLNEKEAAGDVSAMVMDTKRDVENYLHTQMNKVRSHLNEVAI